MRRPPADVPSDPDALRAGQRLVLDGRGWTVSSLVRARIAAAEGELPFAPALDDEFSVADLRNADDEVATLDYGDVPPHWSVGRSVALADLALTGLRDRTSEKTLSARGLQCPSCGAAVEVKLDTTQLGRVPAVPRGDRCLAGRRRRSRALPPGQRHASR